MMTKIDEVKFSKNDTAEFLSGEDIDRLLHGIGRQVREKILRPITQKAGPTRILLTKDLHDMGLWIKDAPYALHTDNLRGVPTVDVGGFRLVSTKCDQYKEYNGKKRNYQAAQGALALPHKFPEEQKILDSLKSLNVHIGNFELRLIPLLDSLGKSVSRLEELFKSEFNSSK